MPQTRDIDSYRVFDTMCIRDNVNATIGIRVFSKY